MAWVVWGASRIESVLYDQATAHLCNVRPRHEAVPVDDGVEVDDGAAALSSAAPAIVQVAPDPIDDGVGHAKVGMCERDRLRGLAIRGSGCLLDVEGSRGRGTVSGREPIHGQRRCQRRVDSNRVAVVHGICAVDDSRGGNRVRRLHRRRDRRHRRSGRRIACLGQRRHELRRRCRHRVVCLGQHYNDTGAETDGPKKRERDE